MPPLYANILAVLFALKILLCELFASQTPVMPEGVLARKTRQVDVVFENHDVSNLKSFYSLFSI
jgi:hypothetical protein